MAYMGCHMYNENDDEIIKPAKDVFEINDFTAATEWENFIDDIENIFRNWRLSQSRKRVKVSLCQQLASSHASLCWLGIYRKTGSCLKMGGWVKF